MTWEEFVTGAFPAPYAVTVDIWQGGSGYGDTYAAGVQVSPCVIDDTTRAVTVQTADAQGTDRLSSTTVYAPLEPTITPGSRITLPWRTKPATVLAVSRMDDHGIGLPAHQELSLE